MPAEDRSGKLAGLMDIWGDLGDRERLVLLEIAKRLLSGQESYGKLTAGKKNWTKEGKEEAMDLAVYMACLLSEEKP